MENKESYSKVLIAGLLLIGSFIAVLNQTFMITAIPPLMVEMNITANTGQWLTTVFMLVMGIMVPISAFLIEKFTTRQLFLTAMGIFTIEARGRTSCFFSFAKRISTINVPVHPIIEVYNKKLLSYTNNIKYDRSLSIWLNEKNRRKKENVIEKLLIYIIRK